ncbi:MAG: hypothetical protein ACI93R_004083 [Flavobacteriales bacterium]|jgi:hypothetical protein
MKKIRPAYVDIALARKYKIKSTVLLLEVTQTQAILFINYWAKLKLMPGSFNLLGGELFNSRVRSICQSSDS